VCQGSIKHTRCICNGLILKGSAKRFIFFRNYKKTLPSRTTFDKNINVSFLRKDRRLSLKIVKFTISSP
jgi:hypothetical protein